MIKKTIGCYNLIIRPPPMTLLKNASYLKDKEWLRELVAPAYMDEDDPRREWFYVCLYENNRQIDFLLDPDFSPIFYYTAKFAKRKQSILPFVYEDRYSFNEEIDKKQYEYNSESFELKQCPWTPATCMWIHKMTIANIEQRCRDLNLRMRKTQQQMKLFYRLHDKFFGKKVDEKNIIKLLLMLRPSGETSFNGVSEIANSLKNLGIKGQKSSAHYCPIANYLRQQTGNKHVTVSEQEIEVGITKLSMLYDHALMGNYFALRLDFRDFLWRFDSGKYPELIEE